MKHECRKQIIRDGDKFLDCFEAFMLDEAHELKKQGLLILAIIRNHLKRHHGKNKKLIITSATLDTKLFEDYFQDFSRITIEALTPTYDVEVYYTQFPDLESNIIENTACHLKVIFEVSLINISILRKILARIAELSPTFLFLCHLLNKSKKS